MKPNFYRDREKYTEDVRRCEELGRYIKDRIGEVFGSQSEAGNRFSELTGLKEISARGAVNNYCTGHFVMGFSSASDTQGDQKMHRRRLAILFTILYVEECDHMVALAREINPMFEYPIQLDGAQGYSGRDARERPKVSPEAMHWMRNLKM